LTNEGRNPSISDFTYHVEDNEIVNLIIESTNYPYELSQKWFEEEKKAKVISRIDKLSYEDFMREIIHNQDEDNPIYYHKIDGNYKNEVEDALIYFKLKKIKRLILANDEDLRTTSDHDQILHFLDTHLYLKNAQMELGKKKGIVIYPFS
jgi:DNA primase